MKPTDVGGHQTAKKPSRTLRFASQRPSASYESLIEEECRKLGINPALGKAVATAESGMKQDARSSAGAIGVMQLMPGTADDLGVDPTVATENIQGGLRYLSQLLAQFDGDTGLALAAYNAGPGNVLKHGGIPPFRETEAYVKRVMGLAAVGGAGGESAELADDVAATLHTRSLGARTFAAFGITSEELAEVNTPEEAARMALRLMASSRYNALRLMGDTGDSEDDDEGGTLI